MRDRTPPMGIEMNTHIIRTSMLGLFWKSPNQENRRPARTSRTRISPMQRSLNSRTRAPHRRPSKGGRTSMAKWASFFTPTPIPRNTIQIRMNRTSSSDQRNSGFCSTYRTNTWAETHTVITEINPKVIHLWIPSSRSTRRFMESPRETAARRNLGPRPAAVITWVLLLPLALDRVEDVGDPHLLRDALTHREGDVHHLLFLLEGIELHPELALHLRHCLVVLPPLGGPGYRRSLLRRPQHDLLLRRRELGPGLAAHEEGPHGDDVRCLGDVGTHLVELHVERSGHLVLHSVHHPRLDGVVGLLIRDDRGDGAQELPHLDLGRGVLNSDLEACQIGHGRVSLLAADDVARARS